MSRLMLLTPTERKAFDTPPTLSEKDRQEFFNIDETLSCILAKLSSDINRIGFLLQYGYFKATGRFFKVHHFHDDDVHCASQATTDIVVDITQYNERTIRHHQQQIATLFRYKPFDS